MIAQRLPTSPGKVGRASPHRKDADRHSSVLSWNRDSAGERQHNSAGSEKSEKKEDKHAPKSPMGDNVPSPSSNEWEDEAEMYHRMIWLDSAPAPLDHDFQNCPLPQEMPAQDCSLQPKQDARVSDGNFPSFGQDPYGSFASETALRELTGDPNPWGYPPNNSFASETVLDALTGDLNPRGYPPPQSVGYNQMAAAQQYSSPFVIDQDFGFQGQFSAIQNPHLADLYNPILQGQQDELQNIPPPGLPQQFICDPNHQPVQAPLPSAIAQTVLHEPPQFAVQEPLRAPADINIGRGGRVRARRGQATDPHSIAERLRRKKIAEGMDNMHQLVPNASQTNKASMIEAVINYVSFLQSRLKATNCDDEKSSDRMEENDEEREKSDESREVEKQLLGLMESNVSEAGQLLRSKGLCLMPVSLAAAVAAGKGISSDPKGPIKRKKAHHGRPIKCCHCNANEVSPDHNPEDWKPTF